MLQSKLKVSVYMCILGEEGDRSYFFFMSLRVELFLWGVVFFQPNYTTVYSEHLKKLF